MMRCAKFYISSSEETLISFAVGLYSKKFINEEKRNVLDKCRSRGADTLMDLVGKKIEMGYKQLDTVLALLEGEENLKHFVDKSQKESTD